MPETPLMATSEGWRGTLKNVKSEKAAPVSDRNETLCPATTPVIQTCKSVCMGQSWGPELRLCHWNNSGTIGSSLKSFDEPWSGGPGSPESGS